MDENIQTADELLEQAIQAESAGAEAPEADAPQQEQEAGEFIEIGGKRFRADELQDIVEKGLDYTRKTQMLAEERRKLGEVEQLYQTYSQLPPEVQSQVAEAIAQAAMRASEPSVSEMLREAGYDEEYVQAVEKLEQRNQQLGLKLTQLERTLQTVLPEFQGLVAEIRGDTEARRTADRLRNELGVEVTPEELREAQRRTGLDDLEAAWLKANKARLVQGAYVQGHRSGARARPVSPAGDSRTPDLTTMTADEILAAINSGLIKPPTPM
jgi:hypothetical protein